MREKEIDRERERERVKTIFSFIFGISKFLIFAFSGFVTFSHNFRSSNVMKTPKQKNEMLELSFQKKEPG